MIDNDDEKGPSKRAGVKHIGVVGPAVLSSVIVGAIALLSDVNGLVNLFSGPWPVVVIVVGVVLVIAGVLLLIQLWNTL